LKIPLKIIPLYKRFFRFLGHWRKGRPAWPVYWRHYCFPYWRFFAAYFSLFPLLDRQALKERVGAIRPQHYWRLRLLLRNNAAEKILRAVHERCFLQAYPEDFSPIIVYLIIGFFSPEAFLLALGGEKVIVFGLERFRDLSSLDLLYAHEYAHLLLGRKKIAIPQEKKAAWYLISEGLASWFSSQVLPERPLTDHLFLRRDRFNWCLENEDFLKDIFRSSAQDLEKIIRYEQQGEMSLGLPPRALHFLGYRVVENYIRQFPGLTFSKLIGELQELWRGL